MLLTEFDEKAYIEGVKKQSFVDGEEKSKEKMIKLIAKMKEAGREEDIIKLTDKKELEKLYKEFNL